MSRPPRAGLSPLEPAVEYHMFHCTHRSISVTKTGCLCTKLKSSPGCVAHLHDQLTLWVRAAMVLPLSWNAEGADLCLSEVGHTKNKNKTKGKQFLPSHVTPAHSSLPQGGVCAQGDFVSHHCKWCTSNSSGP
jgi:hypothetical protein